MKILLISSANMIMNLDPGLEAKLDHAVFIYIHVDGFVFSRCSFKFSTIHHPINAPSNACKDIVYDLVTSSGEQ